MKELINDKYVKILMLIEIILDLIIIIKIKPITEIMPIKLCFVVLLCFYTGNFRGKKHWYQALIGGGLIAIMIKLKPIFKNMSENDIKALVLTYITCLVAILATTRLKDLSKKSQTKRTSPNGWIKPKK